VNPQSTAVDAAVAGIKELFTAANPGCQVGDGPALSEEHLEDETFLVGYGQPAYLLTRSDPDYGGRVTETGEIVCAISVISGLTDMAVVRARVVELLANFEAVLRDDPTMGGRVDDSALGPTMEGTQEQTPDGAIAAMAFSVRYEAHI
jgi:hypothetical protein